MTRELKIQFYLLLINLNSHMTTGYHGRQPYLMPGMDEVGHYLHLYQSTILHFEGNSLYTFSSLLSRMKYSPDLVIFRTPVRPTSCWQDYSILNDAIDEYGDVRAFSTLSWQKQQVLATNEQFLFSITFMGIQKLFHLIVV